MSRRATYKEITALLTRRKAWLRQRTPHMVSDQARIDELSFILNRLTAHTAGIRSIKPTGD